ncbi:hypothetical protein PInf_010270 [Phytophthora infestans]|nr:hypothetical protein PInf_010270 [Phytophthora infestans]
MEAAVDMAHVSARQVAARVSQGMVGLRVSRSSVRRELLGSIERGQPTMPTNLSNALLWVVVIDRLVFAHGLLVAMEQCLLQQAEEQTVATNQERQFVPLLTSQLSSEATDPEGNLLGVTYGATPNTLATWDATKIQGCDCETNDYFGPYENAFGDLTGAHDCSARMCPRGADPFEVGKVNEKQTVTCTADAGEFTLTFRGETTPVIPFNAGAAQVQSTLQTLESVRTATVTFNSGAVVCSAAGVITTVEFTFMQGDLSPLSYDITALTLAGNPATMTVTELVKGTKANIECSARGICDRGTGVCDCYSYFLSSDGAGGLGRRGDCGYISPYPSVALS